MSFSRAALGHALVLALSLYAAPAVQAQAAPALPPIERFFSAAAFTSDSQFTITVNDGGMRGGSVVFTMLCWPSAVTSNATPAPQNGESPPRVPSSSRASDSLNTVHHDFAAEYVPPAIHAATLLTLMMVPPRRATMPGTAACVSRITAVTSTSSSRCSSSAMSICRSAT